MSLFDEIPQFQIDRPRLNYLAAKKLPEKDKRIPAPPLLCSEIPRNCFRWLLS
jgi:hypothetical protein